MVESERQHRHRRGDAAVQGAAAGNMMDITTMNNTAVNNSQIVGAGAAIGSNINVGHQQYLGQRRHPEPGGLQRRQRLDRSDLCLDPLLPGVQRVRSGVADQRQRHQCRRRCGDPGLFAGQQLRGGLQRPEHADLEQADQQFDRWPRRSTPMSTMSAARPACPPAPSATPARSSTTPPTKPHEPAKISTSCRIFHQVRVGIPWGKRECRE